MPKTTLKVRSKLWDLFNRECKAASLRRDDFLDRALPGEIKLLHGIPACDAEGEQWLKRNWLDRWGNTDTILQPVSVMLSQSVIDDINAACSAKRVLRDAFLDCALYYFTERLYEAVVVIKNPRNTRDLVSQIASVLNDPREELTEEDRRRFIVETIEEWAQPRRLERFSGDFYREEMSWDATRVADEKTKQELFLDFEPRDPEKVAERLDANDKSNRGTA